MSLNICLQEQKAPGNYKADMQSVAIMKITGFPLALSQPTVGTFEILHGNVRVGVTWGVQRTHRTKGRSKWEGDARREQGLVQPGHWGIQGEYSNPDGSPASGAGLTGIQHYTGLGV
ncbi:hypothetical protein FKM82_030418 [Ascaphus truei]